MASLVFEVLRRSVVTMGIDDADKKIYSGQDIRDTLAGLFAENTARAFEAGFLEIDEYKLIEVREGD